MRASLKPIGRNLGAALRRRLAGDTGGVATEYGLLLLLIALVIVVAVTAFGLIVSGMIQTGADAF